MRRATPKPGRAPLCASSSSSPSSCLTPHTLPLACRPHLGPNRHAAVSGVESTFTVFAKDAFSNHRDGTGIGDGKSDPFLVIVEGPSGGTVVTSTARVALTVDDGTADAAGFFTLTYDGATTRALAASVPLNPTSSVQPAPGSAWRVFLQ